MAMSLIWTAMVGAAILCGLATGNGPAVARGALDGAAAVVLQAVVDVVHPLGDVDMEPGAAVVGLAYLVALVAKLQLHHTGQLFLVLHQKDTFRHFFHLVTVLFLFIGVPVVLQLVHNPVP